MRKHRDSLPKFLTVPGAKFHNHRAKRQLRFGERFKAILVEDNAWGLEVSVYIHLSPIATEAMKWGKRQRAAERRGLARPPTKEELERRLKALREFKLSSYGAYAGYVKPAAWLDREPLLDRAGKDAVCEEGARKGADPKGVPGADRPCSQDEV